MARHQVVALDLCIEINIKVAFQYGTYFNRSIRETICVSKCNFIRYHFLFSGHAAQVWCRFPPDHHILIIGASALCDRVEIARSVIKC